MVRHPRDKMRRLNKIHTLLTQYRMHFLNISDPEVQNRPTNRDSLLRQTDHQPNRPALKLAAAEQVRPPTMTRIVNALEEQGLVLKKQNANDGRSTLLSATSAGKKLLMEGRARRVCALAKQIAALNHEQRSALQAAAEILKKVVRTI